jgi:septum site-determining protein MinD
MKKPKARNQSGRRGAGRSIAVVSGKGGSGKTIFAVAMAQTLSLSGYRVLMIDTDFGTGGLTYYLTFNAFTSARLGLSEFILGQPKAKGLVDIASYSTTRSYGSENPFPNAPDSVALIPIGDQRSVYDLPRERVYDVMTRLIDEAAKEFDYIIADCRGGIDEQSTTVCEICDHILMIVETDATAIQASQHLVDVLSQRGLKDKLLGFVLNKVMDDPTTLAKAGNSFFRSHYLGAVPFDIDTTRAYIQGNLPRIGSLFSRHVMATVTRMFPDRIFLHVQTLSPNEFSTVSLRSPETRVGGIILFGLYLYVSFFAWYSILVKPYYSNVSPSAVYYIYTATSILFLGMALSDAVKQAIGRAVRKMQYWLLKWRRRW